MPLNATDTETERISQTSVGASATILIRGLAASHKLLIFNHHRRPALANPSSHTEAYTTWAWHSGHSEALGGSGVRVHRACLEAASVSMAVAGCRKWVTSAMCTPSSNVPLGRGRMCRASSMSLHPGGSTLQMGRCRRSSLHMQTGVSAL